MGMAERAGMDAARHQPGEMGHVDHQIGADAVGDRPEAGEVDHAGVPEPPATMSFGLCSLASRSTSS
jgi:hypothetical protein